MNKTLYSVLCMMALIAFVALLWGSVGYVYADAHPLRRAAVIGGGILVVGWLLVFSAAAIKLARLRARRRESNARDR